MNGDSSIYKTTLIGYRFGGQCKSGRVPKEGSIKLCEFQIVGAEIVWRQ